MADDLTTRPARRERDEKVDYFVVKGKDLVHGPLRAVKLTGSEGVSDGKVGCLDVEGVTESVYSRSHVVTDDKKSNQTLDCRELYLYERIEDRQRGSAVHLHHGQWLCCPPPSRSVALLSTFMVSGSAVHLHGQWLCCPPPSRSVALLTTFMVSGSTVHLHGQWLHCPPPSRSVAPLSTFMVSVCEHTVQHCPASSWHFLLYSLAFTFPLVCVQ